MRRGLALLVAVALSWAVGATTAYAQKGVGDAEGVARQAVKPKVVSISGKVVAVKTEPCKMTTGPSYLGTHFLLQTPAGKELNIHLGPANMVGQLAERLAAGRKVNVEGFRTDKMQREHYVAQSVALGKDVIELRDDALRPVWAGGAGVSRGRAVGQWAPGNGRGQGYGRGGGSGWGRGAGRGYGRGAGWGQGGGYGRGLGRQWGFIDRDGDGVCDNLAR